MKLVFPKHFVQLDMNAADDAVVGVVMMVLQQPHEREEVVEEVDEP